MVIKQEDIFVVGNIDSIVIEFMTIKKEEAESRAIGCQKVYDTIFNKVWLGANKTAPQQYFVRTLSEQFEFCYALGQKDKENQRGVV
jgi:hypothetical protein